jgi:hypothetical protein
MIDEWFRRVQAQKGAGQMSAKATTEDADVKILLGAIYQRLNRLTQEMGLIKLAILKEGTAAPSPGSLSALGGAWSGIEISEEDIGKARISLPGEL